jgi:LysM repeat protein
MSNHKMPAGWPALSQLVRFLFIVIAATSQLGLAIAQSAQPQGPIELLTNPTFDEPFVPDGQSIGIVAHGWTAWWLTPDGVTYPTVCASDANQSCVPYGLPLFNNSQPQDPKVPPRALSGSSQQWGSAYTIYIGGVYQQVGNIRPGTRLNFSAYTQGFNCDDNRGCFGGTHFGRYGYSYEPGDMRTRVGLDPTGGTDPFSPSIIWSGLKNPLDAFVQQQIEAVAQSSTVTVFIWSAPTFPERHTDIYVDNASLVAVGFGPAPATSTPSPSPANTPGPTDTPGPTNTPGPTVTPLSGTPTIYVVQPGDSLSAIAQHFGLSLDQLMALNTLGDSNLVFAGQTSSPTPTATIRNTATSTTSPSPSSASPAPTETSLGGTPEPTAELPATGRSALLADKRLPTDVMVVSALMILAVGGLAFGIRAQRK